LIDWADLEARNAPLNAFVDWDKGVTGGDGAMSGLTFGIKSNIAVAGLPWTGGMGVYRDRLAERDADVVARLRAAGATILGTLNMHEAALGATTDNAFYGRTHNAHLHGYTPGGSSGGSGAAVAAGLCDAALGTDTMGSVRIPATYNGVYGLKPTHGAVSQEGLAMLEPGLDCIGPLARDLDVLKRVWEVIREVEVGPRIKPGLTTVFTLVDLAGVDVQPAVRAAYDRALAALDLPTRTLSLADAVTDIRMAGFIASARWLIGDLGELRRTRAEQLSPELHFMLDYAEKYRPRSDVITRTRTALVEALGDDGLLLMPTAPQVAFPHGRPPANQADFTCLASVAGLPALALPAGLNDDRLPVGVQIVGPAGSEAQLFAIARYLDDKLRGYAAPLQGA
jgi:aspartyl-tRNA(Asn)/glutamyl-tRNA(Gln) amidotransferase subunit A